MSPHRDQASSATPVEAAPGAAPTDPPPVLIVPGAWTTARAFDVVRDELGRHGHAAQVLDLPARARRLPQLDRGGLGAIDRALDDAIAATGTTPILIGHSLGGLACLRASRRHPLPALVLLMPAPPAGLLRSMLADAVRRPVNTATLVGAALSMRIATRLSAVRPAGMYSADVTPETLRRAAGFRADESWTVLAALLLGSREPVAPSAVPTLVVGGSQDLVTPAPAVEHLAAELRATYLELDVAHAFNEEPSYPVVTDRVVAFLAAVRETSGRGEPPSAAERRSGPTGS